MTVTITIDGTGFVIWPSAEFSNGMSMWMIKVHVTFNIASNHHLAGNAYQLWYCIFNMIEVPGGM